MTLKNQREKCVFSSSWKYSNSGVVGDQRQKTQTHTLKREINRGKSCYNISNDEEEKFSSWLLFLLSWLVVLAVVSTLDGNSHLRTIWQHNQFKFSLSRCINSWWKSCPSRRLFHQRNSTKDAGVMFPAPTHHPYCSSSTPYLHVEEPADRRTESVDFSRLSDAVQTGRFFLFSQVYYYVHSSSSFDCCCCVCVSRWQIDMDRDVHPIWKILIILKKKTIQLWIKMNQWSTGCQLLRLVFIILGQLLFISSYSSS